MSRGLPAPLYKASEIFSALTLLQRGLLSLSPDSWYLVFKSIIKHMNKTNAGSCLTSEKWNSPFSLVICFLRLKLVLRYNFSFINSGESTVQKVASQKSLLYFTSNGKQVYVWCFNSYYYMEKCPDVYEKKMLPHIWACLHSGRR